MIICRCGNFMEYNIPNDESAPPYCECPCCGDIMVACGSDPAYTSSTLHKDRDNP